ncbi:MAG: hypothetical protein QXQ14_03015 [Candidatus Aenigmatarchaeota archaeon]
MRNKFKKILILSLVFSIITYLIGLITGIKYGNEILKTFQFQNNFSIIKNEIENLYKKIDSIKFIAFTEFLDENEKCKILQYLLQESEKVLEKYYKTLPYRLEEYELQENLPSYYLDAKSEYQKLLIDRWLISKTYEKCNNNSISILYFYKPKCYICVKQGEEMDKISNYLKEKGYIVFINTLDITFSEPSLEIIKKIYNISDAPSFIIKNLSFSNFTSFETFKLYFEKTY